MLTFNSHFLYRMSKLSIYRASAGSGKTFALTLEYFRIVFTNPSEYKNILAVTFTNKATEEMKSRIINELHKLAEGEKSSYGDILKKELGFSDDQLKNRAGTLRTLLLHDYGRLSVTTIDRFFQRIIKSFTRELGIYPGYNVELDSDFVLLKAVDKVMQKMKTDANLRQWIRELMNFSVDEGKSWSVKSKISELGQELFKENYMLFDKKILDKFSNKDFLKEYKAFLNHIITGYEEDLVGIGTKALEMIDSGGLTRGDFKGKERGFINHFLKLVNKDFEGVTVTTRNAVDNIDAWVNQKSEADIKNRIETVYPGLNSLLKESIGSFDNQGRAYSSAKQLIGNLYQLGILNDLYQEIRTYCNENGLMLLSDTTHILNILIAGNDTSFLFEKSGNYYKHLMIDEFQDTSIMQWTNFRPLVVNSLSEGYNAMIVGDVKQSIYRWRNGDWSLLTKGVEQHFKALGTNNVILKNNWRSAPQIVDFNNTFFEKAAGILKALYDDDAGIENQWSDTILEAYRDLKQEAKRTASGYVDLYFGPEKKEEESAGLIMENILTIIHDITTRKGLLRDIVILVRDGKEGAFVANYLMEYNKKTPGQEINFISNDSLYVNSSLYVRFIVAILKYIVTPYDLVNKATIIYFYYVFISDCKYDSLHDVFKSVREEELFQFLNTGFSLDAGSIMSYSLFETIEAVIDKFSLKNRAEEIPYLIAFQDIVFEYETNNSNSITLFLEWWEKEQRKKVLSTSEEIDAVRILTIHKSKGLEFEYVILPFCSWELDSVRPSRCIWCVNQEEGFNHLEYAPLTYSSKLADTLFADDYYDEHLKAYIDNLNLLYVALTRSKTELYIRPFAPKTTKDGNLVISDIGAFIYQVMMFLKNDPDCKFAPGDGMDLQYGKRQLLASDTPTVEKAISLESYPIFNLEERVSVKYKYKDYAEVDGSVLSAINKGKLLHEIFKSIEHAGDIEQAVEDVYLSGLITQSEKPGLCEKIEEYLSNPGAAEWFSSRYKVINERDILFKTGSKARPDRVIINGKQAIVIDYKFGNSEENSYLKQVRFYCNTLKQMGYTDIQGYIWYVTLDKIIPVDT